MKHKTKKNNEKLQDSIHDLRKIYVFKMWLLSKDLKVPFGDFDLPDQELGVFKEKEASGWAYGVVKDGAEEPWWRAVLVELLVKWEM